ncbi:MAG: co-chaperone GroES [bacterium]
MANVKPLYDKVLLKPIEEDETTASGIVLPDTHEKEKPEKGEVVAVGEGKLTDDGKRIAPDVKVGDKVLFSKYGPTDVKIDGEDMLIVGSEDILAILN